MLKGVFLLALPFSHEVYTVDDLIPHVPAAYEYLRRVYFNYQKQILRKRLALISDLDELRELYTEFRGLLFDETAQNLVTERIAGLPNAPLTIIFPASEEYVLFTPAPPQSFLSRRLQYQVACEVVVSYSHRHSASRRSYELSRSLLS